jgi:hypothetical protein
MQDNFACFLLLWIKIGQCMTSFALLENFIDNPESLLRKSQSSAASSSATPSIDELVTPASSATLVMARSLYDYSIPVVANVPIGPVVNMGEGNFKLKTGLITMVQANQFCSLPSEDANVHLQHFLELCDTIVIKDVAPARIRLRLFPFSLARKAK